MSRPDPLVMAELPARVPGGAGRLAVELLGEIRSALEERRAVGATLDHARFVIYQQASTHFGDPWWMARVADLEEWTAAHALSGDDLETAWRAWRAGWWIRRLLQTQGDTLLWQHSDAVMAWFREQVDRSV